MVNTVLALVLLLILMSCEDEYQSPMSSVLSVANRFTRTLVIKRLLRAAYSFAAVSTKTWLNVSAALRPFSPTTIRMVIALTIAFVPLVACRIGAIVVVTASTLC